MESPSRSLAKSVIWRIVGIVLLTWLSWAVLPADDGGQRLNKAWVIALTFNAIRFALYYVHERIWTRVRWGLVPPVGAVVWLIGLPCSGKSTIAERLRERLLAAGRSVVVLDGDALRGLDADEQRVGLNADLGFSEADRHENLRRIQETARLVAEAGGIAIVAAITPYEADREAARVRIDRLLLVHVKTPAVVCEARDVKGMWAAARAGKIVAFTGIDAPFEPPASADLQVSTHGTVDASAVSVERALHARRWV